MRNNPRKGRAVAAVIGADTRIGRQLEAKLSAADAGMLPRPTSWVIGKRAKDVMLELVEKQPAIVVNAIIDPDGGDDPRHAADYIAATQGMIEYCRRRGKRYIHVSSARMYGPGDQPSDGSRYSDYDTTLLQGRDGWQQLLAAAERLVMGQICLSNPLAARTMHPHMGFYVLRFGHLLDFEPLQRSHHSDIWTLSEMLVNATEQTQTVVCGNPHSRITPLSTEFAAACVADLCRPATLAPYGFYAVGSCDQVSVQQICTALSQISGHYTEVQPDTGRASSHKRVYGLDAHQAVDSSLWLSRGLRQLPSWKAALRQLVEKTQHVSARI